MIFLYIKWLQNKVHNHIDYSTAARSTGKTNQIYALTQFWSTNIWQIFSKLNTEIHTEYEMLFYAATPQ